MPYRLHIVPFIVGQKRPDHVPPLTKMGEVLSPPVPLSTSTRDIDAPLIYYKKGERGTAACPAVFGKVETYNRPAEHHVVRITDVTGRESDFSLEKNGFQFVLYKSTTTEEDFDNEEYVTKTYYPEIEKLVKEMQMLLSESGGVEQSLLDSHG